LQESLHYHLEMDLLECSDQDTDCGDSDVDSELEALLYSQFHHEALPEETELQERVERATVTDNTPASPVSLKIQQESTSHITVSNRAPGCELKELVTSQCGEVGQNVDSDDELQVLEIIVPSKSTQRNKFGKGEDCIVDVSEESKITNLSSDSDSDCFQGNYEKIQDESIVVNVSNSNRTSMINRTAVTFNGKVGENINYSRNQNPVKKLQTKQWKVNTNYNSRMGIEESMRKFYDSDYSDFEVEDVFQEMEVTGWKVDLMDVTNQNYSRYFSAKPNIYCMNCKQRGHLARNCTEAKKALICHLCGGVGHTSIRCRSTICGICFSNKHTQRQCEMGSKLFRWTCSRCHLRGHGAKICPDMWRMFYYTTKNDGVIMKPVRNIIKKRFCCNCAKEGHYFSECTKGSKSHFVPSPLVNKSYVEADPLQVVTMDNEADLPLPKRKKREQSRSKQLIQEVNSNWKAFQSKGVGKVSSQHGENKDIIRKNSVTNGMGTVEQKEKRRKARKRKRKLLKLSTKKIKFDLPLDQLAGSSAGDKNVTISITDKVKIKKQKPKKKKKEGNVGGGENALEGTVKKTLSNKKKSKTKAKKGNKAHSMMLNTSQNMSPMNLSIKVSQVQQDNKTVKAKSKVSKVRAGFTAMNTHKRWPAEDQSSSTSKPFYNKTERSVKHVRSGVKSWIDGRHALQQDSAIKGEWRKNKRNERKSWLSNWL